MAADEFDGDDGLPGAHRVRHQPSGGAGGGGGGGEARVGREARVGGQQVLTWNKGF
jgi:hypothetical protein